MAQIRVSNSAHQYLQRQSRLSGAPITKIVDQLVRDRRRTPKRQKLNNGEPAILADHPT